MAKKLHTGNPSILRTRVKICGFTRPEDARRGALLGADAIGLVFYPHSPRHVELERAAQIIRCLPPFVTVVALFVDEAAARVRQVLATLSIDLLQFHGDEPADYCRSFGTPYLKAVRVQERQQVVSAAKSYPDARGLLLDAWHPEQKGGTGETFRWDLIPGEVALPIVLAGGLTAENVGRALEAVRPYGVDVSSGVESGRGIKDPPKMAAFIKEVRQFERTF